ncbi:MAG: hypothetical protein R2850_01555 [Bacteroidia bacterium]
MTNHEVKTRFAGDMAFEASSEGQVIRLMRTKPLGGHNSGFRPKPMLLASLSGCTGMDVVLASQDAGKF